MRASRDPLAMRGRSSTAFLELMSQDADRAILRPSHPVFLRRIHPRWLLQGSVVEIAGRTRIGESSHRLVVIVPAISPHRDSTRFDRARPHLHCSIITFDLLELPQWTTHECFSRRVRSSSTGVDKRSSTDGKRFRRECGEIATCRAISPAICENFARSFCTCPGPYSMSAR